MEWERGLQNSLRRLWGGGCIHHFECGIVSWVYARAKTHQVVPLNRFGPFITAYFSKEKRLIQRSCSLSWQEEFDSIFLFVKKKKIKSRI